MRIWLTRLVIPVAVAAMAMVATTLPATPTADKSTLTPLFTMLDGDQEIPGPGDSDGRGVFAALVRGDRLCYALTAVRIETATMAHIHTGPAGVAGPIAVGLTPPNRASTDCITTVPDAEDSPMTLSDSELAAIVADPTGFYVNVHNATFPAGAVRGQLR